MSNEKIDLVRMWVLPVTATMIAIFVGLMYADFRSVVAKVHGQDITLEHIQSTRWTKDDHHKFYNEEFVPLKIKVHGHMEGE